MRCMLEFVLTFCLEKLDVDHNINRIFIILQDIVLKLELPDFSVSEFHFLSPAEKDLIACEQTKVADTKGFH